MDYEVKKYRTYKRHIRFMLIGSGLWPDYREHPRQFRTFLSACSSFSSALSSFGMLNYCVHHFGNINALTRGLGLTISYLSSFLKVYILAVHRKNLLSLNSGVSALFEKDLETPEYRPHLLAYFSSFARFFYVFEYSVALNILMMALTPLLMVRHGKYVRMYPIHIPFSYESGGAVHWSIYAFEVLCGYYCWSITVGVDSVFGLYALHLVGELRLLAVRFESLKSSKDYKKDLKDCVDRHTLLMQSQRIMQKVFGFLAIWLAVTCAVVMCAIIFQATEIKNMTAYKAIYLTCYCFLKLVQAYSYAWFGNIITVESELCLNSIYNSEWAGSGNLQLMNDVLIIQSQNPMLFKAKGCMIVRLDMFSKIVHASVSYFFLLRTLDENLT